MTKVNWHKFEGYSDDYGMYISAEDLPNEGQDVIFCSKLKTGKWKFWTGTYNVDDMGFPYDSDNGWLIDDTMYWAELPETPEEENGTD